VTGSTRGCGNSTSLDFDRTSTGARITRRFMSLCQHFQSKSFEARRDFKQETSGFTTETSNVASESIHQPL
jgi:hypothetical protein